MQAFEVPVPSNFWKSLRAKALWKEMDHQELRCL